MSSEEFSASDEELQLSTRLLETNNWHNTDTLSVDAAIGIFKQSGLTFKQLRDIWTIADKKGSGNLSKHELAVVIRLMGWVQAGEPLHEGLLASAGPIPFIKGITDSIAGSSNRPAINAQIPPINTVDVEHFEVAFNDANPVLGILDREQVMMTLLRNDLSYSSVQKIMDLVAESHKKLDFPKFVLALHLGDLLQSSKITSLPSVIPQYLQDQVSHFKTPHPRPLLPAASPRSSSFPASSSIVTPKQPPTKSDHLPSASQKLESELLLARSRIEFNGAIDGETILKFMTDYKVKPADLAQLWSSSIFDKNNRLTGASLDLFLGRLREKAAGQDASDPPPYPTGTISPLYPVHVDHGFSTDPSRNSAQNGQWSPPFPMMNLDSHASPISLPSYYPYTASSPTSFDVFDHNPNPFGAIPPTSPAPLTNEPISTAALEEIKAETANFLHRVESNFLHQSNQRNRLQFANQMLSDENLALQSKVRDLETKLSDCILPSEHRELQHQYTQEVGLLTADLQRTKELLVSLRDQHEAQEAALRECQASLADSYVETEQLRQSADAQVSLIADLRIQLEGKEKDIADLISKMNRPDMRLLYVRASLRESEASLAKAQDETKNLHQIIATHREDISNLPIQSTAESTPYSIANDGSLQSLARGQGRLSLEVKEFRQMMEQFISSARPRRTELNTHPMAQYRDNMDARSSVETIRLGWGSRPDIPTNHGFHEQPTPPIFHAFSGNSTIHSSQRTETNHISIDSFRHSSSAGGGSVERYPFSDVHSPSNESAPGFDVVSAFEQSSQTSQATTIEPSAYENVDDLGPFRSRDMEHLEDAELHSIKAEGAKLSLQIERCLQQQITAQTNRSHVEYASLISERDVERRQRQEEIRFLTEKLRVKEVECKSLKTQNPISGLQTDLAEAKERAERLQETVDRQNEEIISLKRNRSYEQERAELRRGYEAVDRMQGTIDDPPPPTPVTYESLFPVTTRGAPVSSFHPPPSYEAFSSSSVS